MKILFEETYYNRNDESFKVLCVNRLFDGRSPNSDISPVAGASVTIQSLEDCVDLLWGHNCKPVLCLLFEKFCKRLCMIYRSRGVLIQSYQIMNIMMYTRLGLKQILVYKKIDILARSKAPRHLAHLMDLFNQTCVKLAGESFRHQVRINYESIND